MTETLSILPSREETSTSDGRPENVAYSVWIQARSKTGERWPEPETTRLYQLLRKAALYVIFTVLHKKDPELARDTATKALLKAEQFQNLTTFSSWFYRIAVNDAKMRIRSESRAKETQLDLVEEPLAPSVIATPKMFEGSDLTDREQRLLEFLQARTGADKRFGMIQDFSEEEGISYATGRRVWQKLQEKLKSHLSS